MEIKSMNKEMHHKKDSEILFNFESMSAKYLIGYDIDTFECIFSVKITNLNKT